MQALFEGLAVVLVLHPVCAGLSFLTAALALTALLLRVGPARHSCAIAALIIGIVTALLTSASFAVDVALVLIAQPEIGPLTGGEFTITFGNAPWLTLAGVVLTWVAVILISALVCRCCGIGREGKDLPQGSSEKLTRSS